jgi:hypothetical protein
MYNFDPSKSVDVYDSQYGFGFEITDTEQALEEVDFKSLKPKTGFFQNHSKGCHFPTVREGNLVYVQKGRNSTMKSPFIVKNVEYNPNDRVESIRVEFEPTNTRSCKVSLYAQLPEDPKTVDEPVNFRSISQYISAKDGSSGRLADNGCFWVIPDTTIIKTLDELHISEGLQLII